MAQQNPRRQFLKFVGAAAAAAPVAALAGERVGDRIIVPNTPQTRNRTSARKYELYAGFLLLDEQHELPDFVQPGALEQTLGCGLGAPESRKASTHTESYDSPEALAADLTFRMYGFTQMPKGLRVGACSLRRHLSGRILHANIAYEHYDEEAGDWVTSVSVFAQTSYARPYPLRSADAVEPGGPSVHLEKTRELPQAGVHVINPYGDSFHFIEEDVLYHIDLQISDVLPRPEQLMARLAAF